jgi:uncharacterized phage protein (TIGR01671 family)
MRDIKFRAWTGMEMEHRIVVGQLGAFYVEGLDPKDSACMSPFNTKYGEQTPIMQFTGLHDKNGDEIYEGDIIRILLRRHMEDSVFANADIVYEGAAFWFNARKIGFTDCNWHFYNQKDREVIGNIYETPEMLK